ncbi:hypothetical protein BABINDRAFT_159438 [Babjeviella inositovora NRRL Y-12698]|uniref:GPI transamidase component GAB1 n=1 Tax=Babjeviella inositovora NRRL Y-12698 TaxID=984486 RepID=A0A1E3QZC5_9ASCO|nr:uncharacterized protein BABINDRAFT_159438 [Babjeviella inositovora NRRL Y-12698]ODQ82961.1 hypothetical protein BABINDRAFT_159438 [Babjeviella inositovora NRRL Y-12698]
MFETLPVQATPLSLTFLTAFAARALFVSSDTIAKALTIPELVTPITSYKALLEAHFLAHLGADIYDNSVVHHQPLVVAAFSLVYSLGGQFLVNLCYIAADLAVGWYLVCINRTYHTQTTTRVLRAPRLDDYLVAAIYLFNPLTLLSMLSRSTVLFTNLALAAGFFHVLSGNLVHCLFCLAATGYTDLYSLALVVPFASVYYSTLPVTKRKGGRTITSFFFLFAIVFGDLLGLSYAANGFSWSFLARTYGTIATLAHLTPNVGLWWYFFTEMFEFFTPFYHGVFNLFLAAFVTPVTLRFHAHRALGLLTLTLVHTLLTFTKSYPSWGDLVMVLSLLSILTPFHQHLRYAVISGVVLLFAIILSPVNYYLWFLGSGNSNFFYAINLVLGVALGLIIGDLTYAGCCVGYQVEHGVTGKLAQI